MTLFDPEFCISVEAVTEVMEEVRAEMEGSEAG